MVCMFPRRMHREMTVRPEEIVSFFKMNLVWRWKFRHIGIGRCWKYLVLSTTDTRTDIESIERNWDCRMGDCLCTLPLRRITWRWATIQFGHWLQLTPRHCIHICAQCIWSTTFYTLIGYMWEERRLEEALMLVTPHFVVIIPGKMFLISADLFPTLSRCRLFG